MEFYKAQRKQVLWLGHVAYIDYVERKGYYCYVKEWHGRFEHDLSRRFKTEENARKALEHPRYH